MMERNGLYVRRKLMESISSTVLVQRGDKVVQGLSAEDLLDLVSSPQSRKQWDDKIDSTTLLESYGDGSFTSFMTTKASFPFRGRAFHLASLTARGLPPSSLGATSPGESTLSSSASSWSGPAVYFHASASYVQQGSRFAMDRINPANLPLGRVLIDGWILETLDPYSSTSFQIHRRDARTSLLSIMQAVCPLLSTQCGTPVCRGLCSSSRSISRRGVRSLRSRPRQRACRCSAMAETRTKDWSGRSAPRIARICSSRLASTLNEEIRRCEHAPRFATSRYRTGMWTPTCSQHCDQWQSSSCTNLGRFSHERCCR